MFELSLKRSSEYDELYIKLNTYVLGAHSTACSFAVLSEFGQYAKFNFPDSLSKMSKLNYVLMIYMPDTRRGSRG